MCTSLNWFGSIVGFCNFGAISNKVQVSLCCPPCFRNKGLCAVPDLSITAECSVLPVSQKELSWDKGVPYSFPPSEGCIWVGTDQLYKGLAMSNAYLNLQPLAKRACHPPSEEQYKSAVGTMEGAVEAVKLLLQKGSPPAWVAAKLEALHTAITILRDSVR